jgi:hypothetical protein
MKGLEPSTFCMANGPPNGSEPERTPSVAIVATVKPTLVDAGCDTRWLFLGDGEHPRRVERPLRRWAKPVADRVPSRCRPHERHAPLAQRHIPSASGPIVVERSIGTAERGEADGLAIDPHAPLGRVPTPLDRRLGPPHSVADKQPRDARDFRASTPVTPRLGNVWGAEEAEKISFRPKAAASFSPTSPTRRARGGRGCQRGSCWSEAGTACVWPCSRRTRLHGSRRTLEFLPDRAERGNVTEPRTTRSKERCPKRSYASRPARGGSGPPRCGTRSAGTSWAPRRGCDGRRRAGGRP